MEKGRLRAAFFIATALAGFINKMALNGYCIA
jgi:hypothetical protein